MPARLSRSLFGSTRLPVRALLRCLHVGGQHFEDHAARRLGPLRRRLDHHAVCNLALAGCRQHTFAFNLDHAGTTIAIGSIAWLVEITEMRDFCPFTLGDLPDGFVR